LPRRDIFTKFGNPTKEIFAQNVSDDEIQYDSLVEVRVSELLQSVCIQSCKVSVAVLPQFKVRFFGFPNLGELGPYGGGLS